MNILIWLHSLMTEKESLILVISRFQLDLELIPPFKIIIPMLNNLYKVRVLTSLDGQIIPPKGKSIYDELVKKLSKSCGSLSLNQILQKIVRQCEQTNFNNYRVCILGHEKVDWRVIMDFKRRNIVVDTVCGQTNKNNLAVQISYITGGVHKKVKEDTIIQAFQDQLGRSSKIRHSFKTQKTDTVKFELNCSSCDGQIHENFYICSVCFFMYCNKHSKIKICSYCNSFFD